GGGDHEALASRSARRCSTHSSNSAINQPRERGPRWIGLGANPSFCRSYQVEVGTPVSSYRCASRATPLGLLVCIGPSRLCSSTVVYVSHDFRNVVGKDLELFSYKGFWITNQVGTVGSVHGVEALGMCLPSTLNQVLRYIDSFFVQYLHN